MTRATGWPATALLLAALLPAVAPAATTTYATAWNGGTIAPGDTAVIRDGGSVNGNVVSNGTLQFDQTASLGMSGTLSGSGALRLTNTGTLALTGLASGTGRYDLAIAVGSGELDIGATGTSALALGISGSGSLTVTGGSVKNGAGFLGAGGIGTATVTGGSWANSRPLTVGSSGTGVLNVSGGTVTNTNGTIGAGAGGIGTVTVESGTWTNSGSLYVGGTVGGTGGSGSLTVTGGTVTSNFVYIGANSTAVGTAVVSGGTWTARSNLNVGTTGTGTLRISGSGGSGGTVIVGGTLSKGTSGTIVLDPGGTLQIGTGTTTGALATDLSNNGSLVFNRTGSGTVSAAISGTGSLTLAGSGTLAFSGTSPFTGPTAVNAGALSVTGSFGTSAISVNAGGRLQGSGAIAGPITINAGGVLSPGVGVESLAAGATTLHDAAGFVFEMNSSATPSAAADLLVVAGDLALDGAVNLSLFDLAISPAAFPLGTTLSLIGYTGGWNGGRFTFAGSPLANGQSFASGDQWWTIAYDAPSGGANFQGDFLPGSRFVTLTAVPEPSASVLVVAGIAAAAIASRSGRMRRAAAVSVDSPSR